MRLKDFSEKYDLPSTTVRPFITQAILDKRDDIVIIVGKQTIRILNDTEFIVYINNKKREELWNKNNLIKAYINAANTGGLRTAQMDYNCVDQLKALL